MEDAHLAMTELKGDPNFQLFGCFDGHGKHFFRHSCLISCWEGASPLSQSAACFVEEGRMRPSFIAKRFFW